jgi:LPXTG-site transpeptidase (sortase) family protein
VPRLGINTVVVEGDNPERLRNGPGHRIGTPPPGARGNTVIVGHRRAWGGPFAALDKIRTGDLIALQTRKKQTVVYKVTAEARVGGAGARLLRQTKDHRLTLITGRGGSFSDDRLIVTAVSGRARPATSRVVPLSAVSPSGSAIFNLTLLIALGALALAFVAFRYLRRRAARAVTVGFVIAPLVALGALCLLLNFDLLLSPLA